MQELTSNVGSPPVGAQLTATEYRLLVEHSPVMIWRSDHTRKCDYFNRVWLEFTGRSMAQELGDGWAEGVHPDDLGRCLDIYVSSFDERVPFEMEYRLRRYDGMYRWIFDRGVPYTDDRGTFLGYIGSCVDVTERKDAEERSRELAAEQAAHEEAERAVRESEARLRRALEIETVGVLFFTVDGQITHANDAFLRMAGYGRDDLAAGGVRWDALTPAEWMPHSQRAVEEFLATGRTTPYEKEYIRKDGSRWWALFAAARLNEREGVEFVLDVTAQKAAEQERQALLERERLARADAEAAIRARDEFVAVIAHDLRNPLAVVSGQVQMVRRRFRRGDLLSTGDLLSRLDDIDASLRGLSALIDDLYDATCLQADRPPELRRRATDLVALAREAVRHSEQASEAHQVRLQCAEPSLMGFWDADRLQRVFANLLSNAIKYSPAGGEIAVEVRKEGSSAVLAVRDQGIGIPAQDLPNVFDRYQRASNVVGRIAGSGLGLAGTREIVEQHGGRIAVQSAEGQGSVFSVVLPLTDARPSSEHGPDGNGALPAAVLASHTIEVPPPATRRE